MDSKFANKIFRFLFLLAFLLGTAGMPATNAHAQVGDPTMVVSAKLDFISLYDWPMGEIVFISINVPGFQPPVPVVVDESVENIFLDGFDIQPGQIVTAEDGILTETHQVRDFKITQVDPVYDVIAGTTTDIHSEIVLIFLSATGSCSNQTKLPNEDGSWDFTFDIGNPNQSGCDIVGGSFGEMRQEDAGTHNATMDDFYVSPDSIGSISGVVRDESGAPITGVSIPVFFSGNGYSDSACSNPDTGAYSNNDLPFDSYVVSASGNGVSCLPPGDNHAGEYWPNSPFSNGAVPIELTSANPSISGIDFTLGPGGTISGVVRDTSGTVITGGRISIALGFEDFSVSTEIYACTNANTGAYQLSHIPLGLDYKVSAVAFPCPNNLDGFAPVHAWPDSPTNSSGTTLTPTLANPNLNNIDFTLHRLGETPAGNNVRAFALNSFITFASVSVAGTTTVVPIETNPPPVPTNFQLLDTFYQVTTTATFTSAQICFYYNDMGLTSESESRVRLYHFEGGTLIDVTNAGYPNTVDNIVCGTASAFSPFAVMIPLDTTPPTITWVGNISNGNSFYFGVVPSEPTCTADDPSGLDGPCTVAGYASTRGPHTLIATARDNAGNAAMETRSYTVLAWTLKGFYQPVDMNEVYNLVKGGSTVPLKFEVFAGTSELTSTTYIKSFTSAQIACDASAVFDEIELTAASGTGLRYDAAAGQFVYNWKTPKSAGLCYRVTMTTIDGSTLAAYFKLK